MAEPSNRYQLPYLGGLITGTGFGLWLYPALAYQGLFRVFGIIGVVFLGLMLVILGVAIGLPTRAAPKEENA